MLLIVAKYDSIVHAIARPGWLGSGARGKFAEINDTPTKTPALVAKVSIPLRFISIGIWKGDFLCAWRPDIDIARTSSFLKGTRRHCCDRRYIEAYYIMTLKGGSDLKRSQEGLLLYKSLKGLSGSECRSHSQRFTQCGHSTLRRITEIQHVDFLLSA